MSLPDTRTENKTCQRVGCVPPSCSPVPRCLLHSSASRERSSQSSLPFPLPLPLFIPLFIPLFNYPSVSRVDKRFDLFVFILFFFSRTHFPLINTTLILYCCLASILFFLLYVSRYDCHNEAKFELNVGLFRKYMHSAYRKIYFIYLLYKLFHFIYYCINYYILFVYILFVYICYIL